jgi:hypothetical protein
VSIVKHGVEQRVDINITQAGMWLVEEEITKDRNLSVATLSSGEGGV